MPPDKDRAHAFHTPEGCTVLVKRYSDPKWGLVEDITLYCAAQLALSIDEPRRSSRHRDHSKNWEH